MTGTHGTPHTATTAPHLLTAVLLWCTAMLLAAASTRAQRNHADRFLATRIDLAEGLPNSNVNQIFADSRGFIWVSTYGGGAVRYDGYTFTAPPTAHEPQTVSISCKGFAEDRHQRLWIAYDEHTTVIDMNTMQRVVPPATGGSMERRLMRPSVKVYRDAKGCIWHVTTDSIFRYTFDPQGALSHVAACRYTGNVPDITVCDVEQNGTVWCGIDGGLFRLSAHGTRLQRTAISPAMQQLQYHFVTDLLRQDHTVWIATNRGLWAYHQYDATLTPYRHDEGDDGSLSHDFVTSLAIGQDGHLLVGTLHGLNVMSRDRRHFAHWDTGSGRQPLPSNFVHCLLARDGQLWIGTETAGIVKTSPNPLVLFNYRHSDSRAESLSPHPVNAIYADREGTVWVGTVEGGLNRKGSGNCFDHWTTANSGLSHNSVSVIVPDEHRQLWIGTWGGGLNVMPTPGQGAAIQAIHLPPPLQQQVSHIGAMAYDRQNHLLWIGSNEGIYTYDPQTATIAVPFAGHNAIRGCIGALIDRDGMLWMGYMHGACIIDLKKGRDRQGHFAHRLLSAKLDQPASALQDKICCFCQTRDGTLWLGSNGYGIYRRRVDKQTGRESFACLTTNDGLASNAVKGIVEDAQGRLWITTANGLSVYDPHAQTFVHYGTSDGLLSQRFYFNSATKAPDGAIYLGSMDGLTEIRGENSERRQPHLTFTRLTVDNQTVTAIDDDILDADITEASCIRLHESFRSMAIDFSSLTYTSHTQGHYSYRLRGFDNEWTTLKPGEHGVRYTSLRPGRYTLEVRYSAKSSPDALQTISIDITVAPYFYKSWWFIALVVMALAALGYLLYRRQMERWKQQETERLLQPIKQAISEADAPEQMKEHIQNMLANRVRMQQSIHRSVEADKEEVQQQKPFVERITEIMEQHYHDSDFSVNELAAAIGMSVSVLSKRLNEETGMSGGAFIRNYRLTVAKRLLTEGDGSRNITEIAYRVGFNDPKYFTRCFSRRYGVSPKNYKEVDNKGDTEEP